MTKKKKKLTKNINTQTKVRISTNATKGKEVQKRKHVANEKGAQLAALTPGNCKNSEERTQQLSKSLYVRQQTKCKKRQSRDQLR